MAVSFGAATAERLKAKLKKSIPKPTLISPADRKTGHYVGGKKDKGVLDKNIIKKNPLLAMQEMLKRKQMGARNVAYTEKQEKKRGRV